MEPLNPPKESAQSVQSVQSAQPAVNQGSSKQVLEASDQNQVSAEEVIPLNPKESAQPAVNQGSSKQVLEASDQNPGSAEASNEKDSSQTQKVKKLDLQNIYSAPIIIEENQKVPEDLTNEYNSGLVESTPIYQNVQENISSSYKYRWGIFGDFTPYSRESSYDVLRLDVRAQFGWMFSNDFEMGIFASVMDMEYRFETGPNSMLRTLDAVAGGFMEYNFVSRFEKSQFVYPAMGAQLGYNRELRNNRLYMRPYLVAKFFLKDDLALMIDLGFGWRSGLNSVIDDIWGVDTNIGFLKYF